MTDRLEELRSRRAATRNARAAANGTLARARAALAAAKKRRGTDRGDLDRLQHEYQTALGEITKLDTLLDSIADDIRQNIASVVASPIDQISHLDARFPVAFFPVRLETRFRRAAPPSAIGELLVRIYPDSLLADDHEPLLTANEIAAGEAYWQRVFDGKAEADSWTALLTETSPERAAWIVERTTPANAKSRSAGSGQQPVFTPQDMRPAGWSRSPEAPTLPERWIVSAFRNGARIHQVLSEPVREGLALTLTTSGDGAQPEPADTVDLSGDGLLIPRQLSWVYDFEEAMRAGMAARIPLSKDDLEQGFSTVLVVGVRSGMKPTTQARELQSLLDSHRYSRGMAFVPPGASTNNTQDGTSDYPPQDPAGAHSFAVARGAAPAKPTGGGARFMRALGLDPRTADHVAGADGDPQEVAGAMADALWPATLGYFLGQMMAPEIDPSLAAALRQHVRDHVRARGHYPPFRIGAVPYGLLPVGALSRWQPTADKRSDPVDAALPPFLDRLRAIWATTAASVPHLGRSSDPERDLIEILATEASAQTVQIRRTLGPDTVWNLFSSAGIPLRPWDNQRLAVARSLLQAIGKPNWDPRILYMAFDDEAHDFAGPLIEAKPLSETAALAFNYISALRAASPQGLKDARAPSVGKPQNALLYLMLRHALLAEYDASGAQILKWRDLLDPAELIETELIDIVPAAKPVSVTAPRSPATGPERTGWARLETKLTGVTGTQSMGDFLADRANLRRPQAPAVKDALEAIERYRSQLQALEQLPTAELHRAFTETLDICSHRLDAWITSIFAKRLEQMRIEQPRGSYSGCYGWVENLKPDPAQKGTTIRTPRGSETARTNSSGYVHAPSMLQASTAAVLRSAYLTRTDAARERYAVNLSSRRARTALRLVDTVRENQPLGAALGYQFERGLHENHPGTELDKFTDEFRALYPLVADKTEQSGEPAETVAARNVVDGLRLREAWQGGAIPWGTGGLTPTAAEKAAIEAELGRLDDAIDAVGDLLLAESVYQIVKGSTAGAAATLDSLAKGQRAPEPEVIATPRGGAAIHQRIALILGDAALPPGWMALGLSKRAKAAPELNVWLAELLGPPDMIECEVSRQDGDPLVVTVTDLALQPTDLFVLARAADLSTDNTRELDRRVAWTVAGTLGADVGLSIDYGKASPGRLSIAEAFELLSSAGRVIGLARPLQPRDLVPPEMESSLGASDPLTAELAGRAAGARNALDVAVTELATAVQSVPAEPTGSETDLSALRGALIGAAAFGLQGAFPASRHGSPATARASLLQAAGSVLAELKQRQADATAALDAQSALRAIFGSGFPILPRFRPAVPDLLAPALATEPDLGAEPDSAIEQWLSALAPVRPPVDAWRQVRLYGRALGRTMPRPRIVQLPFEADDGIPRWVGQGFQPTGSRPRSGLVSLAAFGSLPSADDAWCGLLIDAWPEILPNIEEDTGVAFHYDAPGAQAPQCVLLAVPPATEKNWSYDLIETTLLETFELAKIRAVDLGRLGALGQLIPMTFLAANAANATIATSFGGLLAGRATISPAGRSP